MEVSGQLHAPAALPLGESPLYMLGGPQSRSGRGGQEEEKSHCCTCWESHPGRPAPSLVPTLTELPHLLGTQCLSANIS
jgi:hypothetical protein